MYYNYGYGYENQLVNNVGGFQSASIWVIVSAILAIVLGIVAYCLFVRSNKKISNKYLMWFKEFLDFKKMIIEDLLKVLYIILAIFITLISFELITVNFLTFIVVLILGNGILRLIYESALIFIMIWKNTNEINKKLK